MAHALQLLRGTCHGMQYKQSWPMVKQVRHIPLLSMGGQDYHGLDSVSTTLRALCQYFTSQRKSPLAGIDSPESERVPLAMMPRKPSSVTL